MGASDLQVAVCFAVVREDPAVIIHNAHVHKDGGPPLHTALDCEKRQSINLRMHSRRACHLDGHVGAVCACGKDNCCVTIEAATASPQGQGCMLGLAIKGSQRSTCFSWRASFSSLFMGGNVDCAALAIHKAFLTRAAVSSMLCSRGP